MVAVALAEELVELLSAAARSWPEIARRASALARIALRLYVRSRRQRLASACSLRRERERAGGEGP